MQVEKPLFSRKKQYFFYNKMLETVETIILYTSVIGVSDVIWSNVYDAVGIDYSGIIVNMHFLKTLFYRELITFLTGEYTKYIVPWSLDAGNLTLWVWLTIIG